MRVTTGAKKATRAGTQLGPIISYAHTLFAGEPLRDTSASTRSNDTSPVTRVESVIDAHTASANVHGNLVGQLTRAQPAFFE